jgi:hypothetical protein
MKRLETFRLRWSFQDVVMTVVDLLLLVSAPPAAPWAAGARGTHQGEPHAGDAVGHPTQ